MWLSELDGRGAILIADHRSVRCLHGWNKDDLNVRLNGILGPDDQEQQLHGGNGGHGCAREVPLLVAR
jgi:hypothetical protein